MKDRTRAQGTVKGSQPPHLQGTSTNITRIHLQGLSLHLRTHFYSVAFVKRVVDPSDFPVATL